MTIDYKIRIENGGVTITQHVDAAASGGAPSQVASGSIKILANTFEGSQAANAAADGGDPPGSLDVGGDPPGPLDVGGDPPGPLDVGGGAPAGSGQIAIFGPVVIDATGLVHKHLAAQPPQEKKEH